MRFVYYDGAEDIHAPCWYTTSAAQLQLHEKLDPPPLTSEGACFSHFSWHMLSRGRAWDLQGYSPENLKAAVKKDAFAQAPRMKENFTKCPFGWLGYVVPSDESVGTQPDMIEYACSRAAAWDSPVALWTRLRSMNNHPRTADNLEVFRRWEDAKRKGWLNESHRERLRNPQQEHILLENQDGDFELHPYTQIRPVGGDNSGAVRAFTFERQGRPWVVFWHTSGEGRVRLSLPAGKLRLWEELGGRRLPIMESQGRAVLPVSGRRYLECSGISRRDVVHAFRDADILVHAT